MSQTTRRDAPLALDAETFRALGHRLVDHVAGAARRRSRRAR